MKPGGVKKKAKNLVSQGLEIDFAKKLDKHR